MMFDANTNDWQPQGESESEHDGNKLEPEETKQITLYKSKSLKNTLKSINFYMPIENDKKAFIGVNQLAGVNCVQINNNTVDKLRTCVNTVNWCKNVKEAKINNNIEYQLNILHNIKLHSSRSNCDAQVHYPGETNTDISMGIIKIMSHEIKKKLDGYMYQDKLKNKYDSNKFITFSTIIDALILSELKCYYCSKDVYVLYEETRHRQQWTIDRVDNNRGHNVDNFVICCLECNIQRRCINMRNFNLAKRGVYIKHCSLK